MITGISLTTEETPSCFKKSDLKTGMVVETRNGHNYAVMTNCEKRDVLVDVLCEKICHLDDYREDMTCPDLPDIDIMKVYSVSNPLNALLTRTNGSIVIWKREEKRRLKDLFRLYHKI